MHSHHFFI